MKKWIPLTALVAGAIIIGFFFLRSKSVGEPVEPVYQGLVVIELHELPGVSRRAIRAKNDKYHFNAPILYDEDAGVAYFDLRFKKIYGHGITSLNLSADAAQFNSFVAELIFLEEHLDDLGVDDLRGGGVDGLAALMEGMWGLLTSPIETMTHLGRSMGDLYIYMVEVEDLEQAQVDVYRFCESYYKGKVYDVGLDYGVNMDMTVFPDTKYLVEYKANLQLTGSGLFDVATCFIAWTKFPKVAKVSKLSRVGAFFSRVEPAISKAQKSKQLVKAGQVARSSKAVTALSSLIDPAKLRTLSAGSRKTNPRMNKLMRQLHEQEKIGVAPRVSLDQALSKSNASKIMPEDYHHPNLMRQNVLDNYQNLKVAGVFEDASNLERLKFGKNPIAVSGPLKGQRLDVDHIIPVKYAPELEHNFTNLSYASQTENLRKGAKLTDDSYNLAAKLEKSLGWDQSNLPLRVL